MSIQIEFVASPRYANAEGTAIDCIVEIAGIADPLPFTARPDDVEAHGRELFAMLQAGDFGEVAPYEPPA